MSKERVLDILRQMRTDKIFDQQVRASRSEQEIEQALQRLQQAGIQAEAKDLLEALNVDWVIGELKQAEENAPSRPPPAPGLEQFDLGTELQKGLVRVIAQIEQGYKRIMNMHTVAFYLGVGLVVASVIASLVLRSDASALVLGGLGMADVIVMLIRQPALDLQNSRGNLAQLQAAFVNWINDVYNWNRYLLILSEHVSSTQHVPEFSQVREVSEMLVHHTERTMQLIERYCESYSAGRAGKKLGEALRRGGQPAEDKPAAPSGGDKM